MAPTQVIAGIPISSASDFVVSTKVKLRPLKRSVSQTGGEKARFNWLYASGWIRPSRVASLSAFVLGNEHYAFASRVKRGLRMMIDWKIGVVSG